MLPAALLISGLGLVIGGLVVLFFVAPAMKKLPADMAVERTYTGRIKEILDPTSFIFNRGVPMTIVRSLKVQESTGSAALVREERTMTAMESSGGSGEQLEQLVSGYAVDRHTMFALPKGQYPAEWNDAEGLWPREGIVFSWPIGTEKRDYIGWSDDYRDTVPLVFRGETKHAGSEMDTYKFTSAGEPKPIAAEQVAEMGLPEERSVDEILRLVTGSDLGALGAIVKEQLPEALRKWAKKTVPLQYFYDYSAEYWIEPASGIMIDTRKHERRTVGLGEEFIATTALALLPESTRAQLRVPVSDFTYKTSPQSVADAAEEARSAADKLDMYGLYLPIVLVIAGVADICAGGFFLTRSRTQYS